MMMDMMKMKALELASSIFNTKGFKMTKSLKESQHDEDDDEV